MSIKDHYDNGECPDCGESIPDDCKQGEQCANCDHVFVEPDGWVFLNEETGEEVGYAKPKDYPDAAEAVYGFERNYKGRFYVYFRKDGELCDCVSASRPEDFLEET